MFKHHEAAQLLAWYDCECMSGKVYLLPPFSFRLCEYTIQLPYCYCHFLLYSCTHTQHNIITRCMHEKQIKLIVLSKRVSNCEFVCVHTMRIIHPLIRWLWLLQTKLNYIQLWLFTLYTFFEVINVGICMPMLYFCCC